MPTRRINGDTGAPQNPSTSTERSSNARGCWWMPAIPEVDSFGADEYRAALCGIKLCRNLADCATGGDQRPAHRVLGEPLVRCRTPGRLQRGDGDCDPSSNRSDRLAERRRQLPTRTCQRTLWLKASLLAERNTRGVPRVFVDYGRQTSMIGAVKSSAFPGALHRVRLQDEQAVDTFLTPELRHHQCASITEHFGNQWISHSHDVLCAAAQDKPLNTLALDRIFEEYRSSERAFRSAFDAAATPIRQ